MMKLLSRARARGHRGQTIVLFALMSLVLLAGVGLVMDAGVNYANRRMMQNAADVAALAGARAISRQSAGQPQVLKSVQDTARENGVKDLGLIECTYVNSAREVIGNCRNQSNADPIDFSVAGVRVRVAEEHGTLFMRALGIKTSGTAATSMAQVQQANVMLMANALIAVCGLQTTVASGDNTSILLWEWGPDPFAPQPNPSVSPSPMPVANGDGAFDDGAYSYDWNIRDSVTGELELLDNDRPEYVIQGSSVAKCKKPNAWNGLIAVPDTKTSIEVVSGDEVDSVAVNSQMGDLPNGTGPYQTINGPKGCVRGQALGQGCVIVLPIIDNFRRNGSDDTLYVRAWGAFAVSKVGNEYRGRLIKNYALHADSTRDWNRDYQGPITITLVKLD